MNAYIDKRACKRCRYTAIIEFSYFNKKHCYEAQTLNHCDEGMCFKSEVAIQPGATICIRVKNFHPNGACIGDCRGLRSLILAEAKWCKEILNETEHFYEIGAKYYQPEY
jgi:hypothetical protein